MARSVGSIVITGDRCKGCGLCTVACPAAIIMMDSRRLNSKGYHPAVVREMGKCTGCGNCAQMCPDYAIAVERHKMRGAK